MADRARGSTGIHILVIEDESKIARLLARALKTSGFAVTTAPTGEQGLALAQTGEYRLVILDLMLPDTDGMSIIGRLRETAADVRVFVLSAVADVESKVRCLELGACDYMTKPFDLPELLARVRVRAHERRTDEAARYLRGGGLTLDLRARMVDVGPESVSLSTREAVLLEHLMRNAGDVCGRDDLLEQVWGYTFDPATNVVDVYVARLRQKLGGDAIRTVRNVGYSFVGA
jgi:DNA-binding response OmpR family regulator